jgi:hypothetical protein
MLCPQAALIYAMMVAAGTSRALSDGAWLGCLPAVRAMDRAVVATAQAACAVLLARPGGAEQALAAVRAALPPGLRETAYAFACDVLLAGADPPTACPEALAPIRAQLGIDPASARRIEAAARAAGPAPPRA